MLTRFRPAVLFFATTLLAFQAFAADAIRPNILYFYVDDMGWGSIGPNGQAERRAEGKPFVRTPNLDELARQGVNFTRGYGCTVCSPARSSQQSGFHQGHTFADRNDPDNAKKAMRADDVLIGDALSAAGYVTGYWGKWGYGGSKDQQNPTIDNVQTLPTSHGYQHVLAELHHVRAHTFYQPTLWSAPAPANSVGGVHLVANSMASYRNNSNYPNTPALQNHQDYPDTAYCDDSYAFAALDFVREQGRNYNETGQPFFGLLAVQIPHAPFDEVSELPEWDAAYANDKFFGSLSKQSQQWAAMVTRIDAHFGNVLKALEDPNNDGDTSDSIVSDTLVVFQSDNGGPSGKNNVELDANGGLRGNKGSIHEGGIRVPLVMRWPGKISENTSLRAGSNSDLVVDVTDLCPTFCELGGAPVPLGADGVSLAPTLTGIGHQRRREFIIHEAGSSASIIRGNHKLTRSKGDKLELFDLEIDHAEENDIAASHSALVKELKELMLGERVDEPRGFAATYHHWTGGEQSGFTDASNWSNYRYENAGITYTTDDGAPQLSWIARITNDGKERRRVRADANAEFLALEVAGNEDKGATQSLIVGNGIRVHGRNEIRVAAGGAIRLNEGKLSSMRGIDVRQGTLRGSGTVDGTVYNRGTVAVTGKDGKELSVEDNYHQFTDGTLTIAFQTESAPKLIVGGSASLGGALKVLFPEGYQPTTGQSFEILSADRIDGTFQHANDTIVASDGTTLKIRYSDANVSLSVQ